MREHKRSTKLPRCRIVGVGQPPRSESDLGCAYLLACGHWVETDDKPVRYGKSRRGCPECREEGSDA